jgi:hypothetical protein
MEMYPYVKKSDDKRYVDYTYAAMRIMTYESTSYDHSLEQHMMFLSRARGMSLRCIFSSVKHGIDIYDHTKVCDGRNIGQERTIDFCDMYGVIPETIGIVTDADMFHPRNARGRVRNKVSNSERLADIHTCRRIGGTKYTRTIQGTVMVTRSRRL